MEEVINCCRIELAVIDLARSLDEEGAQGKVRGPLHGIPIIVKVGIQSQIAIQ